MNKLKEAAGPRDAQRLSRLDSPHANAWLSARPSSVDGKDTIPRCRCPSPRPTRVLFFYPCPLCEQTTDLFGDHSLCCKKSVTGNNVRNLVFKLADTGLLVPE